MAMIDMASYYSEPVLVIINYYCDIVTVSMNVLFLH